MLTTPAEASPTPAADRVVKIGTPLQDVLLIGGVVTPGPEVRTVLWSASSGEPAHLSAVDPPPAPSSPATRCPVPAAPGRSPPLRTAASTSAPTFSWTEDTGLTDQGTPGDASFVWDVTTDDDSVVYGGTSPGGNLFSYDPATGEYRDYGRLDPERHYTRSVDIYGDTIHAGTENPARVYAVDRNTGENQALPAPRTWRTTRWNAASNHSQTWSYCTP